MGTAYFTKTKHDGDPPRLKSCDYKYAQNLLQDSLHEGASTAVASLLQRKLVPVAIHEASRLGRNREAWDKKGTSPFGLGVSRVRPTKTALAKTKKARFAAQLLLKITSYRQRAMCFCGS